MVLNCSFSYGANCLSVKSVCACMRARARVCVCVYMHMYATRLCMWRNYVVGDVRQDYFCMDYLLILITEFSQR